MPSPPLPQPVSVTEKPRNRRFSSDVIVTPRQTLPPLSRSTKRGRSSQCEKGPSISVLAAETSNAATFWHVSGVFDARAQEWRDRWTWWQMGWVEGGCLKRGWSVRRDRNGVGCGMHGRGDDSVRASGCMINATGWVFTLGRGRGFWIVVVVGGLGCMNVGGGVVPELGPDVGLNERYRRLGDKCDDLRNKVTERTLDMIFIGNFDSVTDMKEEV
ncbi:hypothetical protein K402DRAFT_404946 [Aulographum hederae CBS 113979]|uniref:Uncharacterized protein n=1 Tax=Aulographum hederae CBS 113979 TaxID=1176131 RepID=A0A6G1GXY8_9PEZI|nr:hypothetical protein K402DRAFT_404946 [Aulographum hederae CBS 113979]